MNFRQENKLWGVYISSIFYVEFLWTKIPRYPEFVYYSFPLLPNLYTTLITINSHATLISPNSYTTDVH